MNFLTGPHANVIQQLQQQQPCGEACGAIDPAGQDLSAMQQQQQSEEDQILGHPTEDRVGAQGESDDDEGEEDEEEGVCGGECEAKEVTDADSQTQNLSSSSESDEQINPQWDEKMWRTVAHRPNHPFQKKAQQVTQQRALGEEESIDNDTIAGEKEIGWGMWFNVLMIVFFRVPACPLWPSHGQSRLVHPSPGPDAKAAWREAAEARGERSQRHAAVGRW